MPEQWPNQAQVGVGKFAQGLLGGIAAGNAAEEKANNLAYLLLEHGGDVNVALSLAQIGRRGMSKSPNSADTLAWAYFHTGAYTAAASLLEDAVASLPEG